jgi:hypothetical protein
MYYLHHYYFVLVKASQRSNFRRSLDLPSLAFLTTIAAFGASYHDIYFLLTMYTRNTQRNRTKRNALFFSDT